MDKLNFSKVGKCLIGICTLFLFVWVPFIAQSASHSFSNIYLVGDYGYLQKLDKNLKVIATGKVPDLVRANSIRDADISPDGKRLFLAVSSDNPLVVVSVEDLSVEEDMRITFPPNKYPFITYAPFSIIAASDRYLYITDEAYTPLPDPHSTVLVDLNKKTAKPIYGYGFMSKTQIEISPNRDKMALCRAGGLYFINISTGKVTDLINEKVIGKGKSVQWFNINWEDNSTELTVVPTIGEQEDIKKVYINLKSRQIISKDTQELKDKIKVDMSSEIGFRKALTATSSKRYVHDSDGNIRIFDRKTDKLLERLDYTLFEKLQGRPVVSYISPDEKLLFYRKDDVKEIFDGRDTQDVSSLCIMDMNTKQIIKTMHFPEQIVTVLFSD